MFQRLFIIFTFLGVTNSHALASHSCLAFFKSSQKTKTIIIEEKNKLTRSLLLEQDVAQGQVKVVIERDSQNKIRQIEIDQDLSRSASPNFLKINELLNQIFTPHEIAKSISVKVNQKLTLKNFGEFIGVEFSGQSLPKSTQVRLVINQQLDLIGYKQDFTSVLIKGAEGLPPHYELVIDGEIKKIDKKGKYNRQKCE